MYVKEADESRHKNKKATILFFDEFDKICMPAVGKGGSDHNKQTQYAFLKLLESKDYAIEGHEGPGNKSVRLVDISNFLYIFGGNFEYIRKADKEKREKGTLGFVENQERKEELLNESIAAKLQENNVAREIAGRISLMASVKQLTKDQLRDILLNAKDNIYEEYQELTDLELSEEEIEQVLDVCIKNKTGARGLRSAIDQLVLSKMFNESEEAPKDDNDE
jgi:ATP-dependent Clp protease ATP-binding subunit ClpX